ncbi:sulfotransferase family protein [Alteromonas macleodii]|uniref:sulfotransferase family protein n=1 Tax=Alteromonas macleodii TaxID=28108 RepID=UPI001930C345|nr:sulfotransferase [Alteromonas macleodii]
MQNKLPDFVCVGSSKCGTTSLFEYLKKHPKIYLPDQKELHYFSHQTLMLRKNGPGTKFVLADIIKSESKYLELFSSAPVGSIIGDISPSYLSCPQAANNIKKLLKNPKIIIMLRNPAEKVFSQYLHLVRAARENLSFEEALAKEEERKAKGWGDMWLYRSSGLYFEDVKRYMNIFGPENIHVVLSEKFKKYPEEELNRIFGFLELPQVIISNVAEEFNRSAVPKNKVVARIIDASFISYLAKKIIPRKLGVKLKQWIQDRNLGEKPKLNLETKLDLLEYYSDDISKLENLLNIKTGWLASEDYKNGHLHNSSQL